MIAVLVLLFTVAVAAAQPFDPSCAGRAGVHDLQQKNSSALSWNPAVLAQDAGFRSSVELPSAGGGAANNAFSIAFWNSRLARDRFLSDADKDEILNRFPADGVQGNVRLSTPLAGYTYNRFGTRLSLESAGEAKLPRELATLILKGNDWNRRYLLGDVRATSETYLDLAAGFGYRFDREGAPFLHFGLAAHFYQGLYLAKVARAFGEVTVTDSLIQGQSRIHSVTSRRGDGAGFDLGLLATFGSRWEVGLALRQVNARITWTVHRNDVVEFASDSTGWIIDSLDDDRYVERAFAYRDMSYRGGTIETRLPALIQATGRFQAAARWSLLGEVVGRLDETAHGRKGLEAGMAAEFLARSYLTLQCGISVGALWHTRFGAGFGLRFRHYELDAGGTWSDGFFDAARGFGLGFAHRLKF